MRTDGLKLVITGDGKHLASELARSERGVRSFAGKAGGILGGLGKKMLGGLGKFATNPLAVIGGTAGLIHLSRQVVDYQDSLSTLGIRAGFTSEKMVELDRRFQALAYSSGQSREAIVRAMQTMVDNVDSDYAVASIEAVAKAATATSIPIEDSAKAFTIFRRDMGATTEEAAKLFNTMVAMDGSFSLDRLANATTLLGVNSKNFESYNAVLHTIKNNTGGIEGAARAMEQVGQTLQNPEVLSEFKRRFREAGINDVFDAEGNIKDFELFMTALQKSGIRFTDLQKHFRRDMAKAVEGFDKNRFDDFIKNGRRATFTADNFARKSKEAKVQLNALSTAGKEFAGIALGPIIEDAARAMSEFTSNDEKMTQLRDTARDVSDVMRDLMVIVGPLAKWVGVTIQGMARNFDLARGVGRSVSEGWQSITGKRENLAEGKTRRERERDLKREWKKIGADAFIDKYDLNRESIEEDARRDKTIWSQDQKKRHQAVGRVLVYQEYDHKAARNAVDTAPEVQNNIKLDIHVDERGNVTTHIEGENTSASVRANRGGLTR